MFYVALGAFAVMVAGLAFSTLIEDPPEPPGPRWACGDDQQVVIRTGECLNVDGLTLEPPATVEPVSPDGAPVPFNPASPTTP